MTDVSNYADLIDVRDLIERFEELDADDERDESDTDEHANLAELLAELRGNGGDHQWQSDWYPVTLIRDSYFTEYSQDFAEDLTSSEARHNWPFNCIDWDRAASELQMDYTSVDYSGIDYWYR